MDKVTKRGSRSKSSAPKMYTELMSAKKNWAPSGKAGTVNHGNRGTGASPAGPGRDVGLDTFTKEQV